MFEYLGDDGGHVVVAVFGEAASEDDVGARGGKGAVAFVERLVALVVDGIVGLHAVVPLGGILARDDGVGIGVDGVAEGLEVFVFDDAGVGHVGGCIVYHGVALMIGFGECLGLETHGAILERAIVIVEKLVDFAGENYTVGHRFPVLAVVEKVGVEAHFDAFEESVDKAIVPPDGDALIEVVEVIVVEGETHRQTTDDEGGELAARTSPLLFGVALDELLIDVAADERQSLFLEITRFVDAFGLHALYGLAALLVEFGHSLGGSFHAPHLIEGVHVEGEIVETSVGSLRHRAVGIAVERHDGIDEVPHPAVGSVEDVGAILMHVYTFDFLAIDISASVRTLVNHEASPALFAGEMSESGAIQSRANYEVVVMRVFHLLRWISNFLILNSSRTWLNCESKIVAKTQYVKSIIVEEIKAEKPNILRGKNTKSN